MDNSEAGVSNNCAKLRDWFVEVCKCAPALALTIATELVDVCGISAVEDFPVLYEMDPLWLDQLASCKLPNLTKILINANVEKIGKTPLRVLNVDDVAEVVNSCFVEFPYGQHFIDNAINGFTLAYVDDVSKLKEFGITHEIHAATLLNSINTWKRVGVPNELLNFNRRAVKGECGNMNSTRQLTLDESSGVAADLFNTYCIRSNGLEELLELVFQEPHLHRHYLIFSQSSGYGKTRLLMHLLKERYAGVMLMCGDISGGFNMSGEIVKLISDFNKQTEDCEKTVVVTQFLRRMCSYIECYHGDREALFHHQFDEGAGKYRVSFADPKHAFSKVSPAKRASVDVARVADSDSGRRHVTFDPSTMMHPREMQMQEWIIVFDEAQCLSEELLARLKVVLDQFGVVGVFVSTCGHLAQLLPMTISTRKTEREVVPPAHILRTFDLHSCSHRLYLGRPLWKLHCEVRCGGDFQQLLWYAVARLCGVNSFNATENIALHRQSTLLSLFMVRFGGISPIDSIAGSTFVTHHMATYTKLGVAVEGNARTIATEVTYPSEPILAEASAYCTSAIAGHMKNTPRFSKVEVIKAVDKCVRSATLVKLHKGDIGEMMACALVGYQMDLIRENAHSATDPYSPGDLKHSMAAPVSVAELLTALYSGAQDCVDDLPELREYTLNVNHFVRLQYPCKYSTCAEVITRGAAVITYECSPGLDFFMEATMPWSGDVVENVSEDLHALALDDCALPEPGLILLANTYRGLPLYSTTKQAVVYFQGGKKRYLGGRPVDKAEVGVEPLAPRFPPDIPSYRNIHVRVSVKNYSNDITPAAAETLLDNVNTACEPVGAVAGGGKETILVNILINMGSGLLVPSISVATPRTTRSGDASYSKAVRLAVGLNHGDLRDGHSCFKHFPVELLQAFRAVTSDRRAEDGLNEDYWAMRYGGDLHSDMHKCVGMGK